MADDADRYSDMTARLEEIQSMRRNMQPMRESATHCKECGAKIPEARRNSVETDYCIKCQVSYETR